MPMASEDVEEGNHESRLRFLLSAQIADAVFSRSRSECWPKRGGLQDIAVVQCTSNRKCVATRRKYGETYHLSYITLPAFKIPQKTKTFFASRSSSHLLALLLTCRSSEFQEWLDTTDTLGAGGHES